MWLAGFLCISSSASIFRMSIDSMPAFIAFVWLMRSERLTGKILIAFLCLVAVVGFAVQFRPKWTRIVHFPSGPLAVRNGEEQKKWDQKRASGQGSHPPSHQTTIAGTILTLASNRRPVVSLALYAIAVHVVIDSSAVIDPVSAGSKDWNAAQP